jgi:hypothetical protein
MATRTPCQFKKAICRFVRQIFFANKNCDFMKEIFSAHAGVQKRGLFFCRA